MDGDILERAGALSSQDVARIAAIGWKSCNPAMAEKIAILWNLGRTYAEIDRELALRKHTARNVLEALRGAGVRLRTAQASRAPSTHAVVRARPPLARTAPVPAPIAVGAEHRARLSRLAVFDPLARQALDRIEGRAPSSQPPEGDSSWT